MLLPCAVYRHVVHLFVLPCAVLIGVLRDDTPRRAANIGARVDDLPRRAANIGVQVDDTPPSAANRSSSELFNHAVKTLRAKETFGLLLVIDCICFKQSLSVAETLRWSMLAQHRECINYIL